MGVLSLPKRHFLLGLWLLSSAIIAHSNDAQPLVEKSPSAASIPLDQQIQLIDAEILLLKAELSRKNAEFEQVQQYLIKLQGLRGLPISTDMQQRIEQLEQYVLQSDHVPETESAPRFQLNTEKVVILLPLSGPFERIGHQILEGLKQQFSNYDPVVIDTYIYDSMLDLWDLVRLYNPSFIIGPLEKHKAQALNDLNTGVPTLYLNEIETLQPYQSSFSLSRSLHVYALAEAIKNNGYEHIVLLTDETVQSQKILADFYQAWAFLNPDSLANEMEIEPLFQPYFEEQTIAGSVDQALSDKFKVERSTGRKNWLQKQIQTKLYFQPRSRKDVELVVSFLPYRQAMQVTPLLEFYHLHSVAHYWLPSRLPPSTAFQQSFPFWHATLALLPHYYANPLVENDKVQNPVPSPEKAQTGIFYAFGELAAKVVIQLTDQNRAPINSELGTVDFVIGQSPQLLPNFYWLEQGSLSLNR